MNPIFAAALEVQEFCECQRWRFCSIGGVAVLRWGEPRLTRYVDVTLMTGFGSEQPVVELLVRQFDARIDDAAGFALRNRVVLLRAANGVPIDVALGALPFEQRAVDRATPFLIDDASILTCSVQDLIVFKVFAGRGQDWVDVEGIVSRNGSLLDEENIVEELEPLLELKGAAADLSRFRQMLRLAKETR